MPRAERKEARHKGGREAPLGAGAWTLTCDLVVVAKSKDPQDAMGGKVGRPIFNALTL